MPFIFTNRVRKPLARPPVNHAGPDHKAALCFIFVPGFLTCIIVVRFTVGNRFAMSPQTFLAKLDPDECAGRVENIPYHLPAFPQDHLGR
jgi:hypothetical protein